MNDELLAETNKLLKKILKRKSLWYAFLNGLMNGLGATVGLAIVLAIGAYLLQSLPITQWIGDWLSEIINNALSGVRLF